MAQLVGEDGFDFLRGEAREQRIEEHDALGRSEAGEIGVAVRRAPRAIDHEQTRRCGSGSVPAAPRRAPSPRPPATV